MLSEARRRFTLLGVQAGYRTNRSNSSPHRSRGFAGAEDLQEIVGSRDRPVRAQMHNPPHPGRIIKEAIEAIPMSVTGFAVHIGVSRVALSRVLNERAGVTPEMSIKISEAFGQNSPDIWFNLQNDHDFWQASQARAGRRKVEPLQSAAA